jgi:hypothetical protein
MRHSNLRTGFATRLAPVLAAWIFLAFVGGATAQVDEQEQARHYAEQSLRVSLWLDKESDEVYRRGEPIQVTFQANEDAYAVIYHLDVDGRVTILWPTTRYSDGFVFGGHQYRLPSRDGGRLRAGEEAGVGYVQAVVSRYPFDLRELALDFHHENGGHVYDYYVAGDPFLAMNEVNYAVTGLEDASAYVVTNYASYYVHQKVDHPRYLCFQCHDQGDYAPYQDTCAVNIHYDYGWMNEWWVSYGFYPAYYYPTYYYVDPWTSARWVNYWYDPWYRWPVVVHYDWPYHCYDWHHSPYWRNDAWTAHEQGRRRYTPLDRSTLDRDREGVRTRTKNELVTAEKPTDDRLRRMRERVVADRGGRDDSTRLGDVGPAGGRTRDVSPTSRSQVQFEPDQRIRTSPGLQVPGSNTVSRGRGDDRRTIGDPGRSDGGSRDPARGGDPRLRGGSTTVRGGKETRGDGRQTIRPVDPRGDTRRVWTNRRSSGNTNVRRQTPPTRSTQPERRSAPTVRRPTRQESSPSRSSGRSSGGSSSGGSVRRAPKQTPKPASPPPSRSSGGSSRGSGGKSSRSRSSGGRG